MCLPVPLNTLVVQPSSWASTSTGVVAPLEEREFFRLLASAESASEHPIGKAIVTHQQRNWPDTALATPSEFEAVPGMGLSCMVGPERVLVGTHTWLTQHQVDIPPDVQSEKQELESSGKTVIFLALNQRLVGLVGIADTPKVRASERAAQQCSSLWRQLGSHAPTHPCSTLRPHVAIVQEEAAITIRRLHQMGIVTYMITGDNHRTAKAIAKLIGIDDVMAEVLPRQKAEKVMELRVRTEARRLLACFVASLGSC